MSPSGGGETLKDGKYKFYIHNYNGGDNRGIKAEIYFNGVTYNYWIKTRVKGYVGKLRKKIIILREYFSGDFSFYPNKEFT